jgi:hypothetical protein
VNLSLAHWIDLRIFAGSVDVTVSCRLGSNLGMVTGMTTDDALGHCVPMMYGKDDLFVRLLAYVTLNLVVFIFLLSPSPPVLNRHRGPLSKSSFLQRD